MKQHDQMRQTVDRLLGEIVCLEWAIAAQDPWSELELRVRDMKKIAKQALSHVNETPKNEHDSANVLKRAPLVRLTDDLASSLQTAHFLIEALNQGKEITYSHKSIAMHQIRDSLQRYEDLRKMDAMERVNGGQQ